jgi:hypothetical protein
MDAFILYVDMLGFSELVLNDADGLDEINPVYRSADTNQYDELEDFYERQASPSEPPPTELAERFTMFHRCLNAARDQVMRTRTGAVLVFSDSAFYQTGDVEEIVDLSRGLMRSLLIHGVPARMGIGHGSFKLLRFMSDSSSQVTLHTSQFLGAGVVRAHGAEQCGAKGMRIFVHPCVHDHLSAEFLKEELVPLDPVPAKVQVTQEVNILYPSEMGQDSDIDLTLFHPVIAMMKSAPDEFKFQYEDTFNALNRMRVGHGHQPYTMLDLMND